MKDRVMRGVIAGTTGGIFMNIWSFTSYHFLHSTKLRYLDWASILLYGDLPKNLYEVVFALFIQLILTAFLGVIFAFIIPQMTSRYYLLKGVGFAIVAYFSMFAIPIIFSIPQLSSITFETAFSSFVGGVIWGLITPLILHWLDTKINISERSPS